MRNRTFNAAWSRMSPFDSSFSFYSLNLPRPSWSHKEGLALDVPCSFWLIIETFSFIYKLLFNTGFCLSNLQAFVLTVSALSRFYFYHILNNVAASVAELQLAFAECNGESHTSQWHSKNMQLWFNVSFSTWQC